MKILLKAVQYRCPADFTRIFTCNNDDIYIKMRHYSSKETGCSNKKDSDWLCQWLWWKPHLLKTAKISIALIRCMLIIISCSSEIYYLYLSFWSKGMKYLCKCNMVFCKNTSLLTGGSLTHKTSADLWRDFWKFPALVRHRTMPGQYLNFTGHRTMSKKLIKKSYDSSCRRPGAVESYNFLWNRRRTVPVDDLWP